MYTSNLHFHTEKVFTKKVICAFPYIITMHPKPGFSPTFILSFLTDGGPGPRQKSKLELCDKKLNSSPTQYSCIFPVFWICADTSFKSFHPFLGQLSFNGNSNNKFTEWRKQTILLMKTLRTLLQYHHHLSSVCLGFSTCTRLITALVLQLIISYPGVTFVRNNTGIYNTINL